MSFGNIGSRIKHHMMFSNMEEKESEPVIYYRSGKPYRKIGRHEVIKEGAMQSELNPVLNETIGDIPANFSDERDFYNPID